MNEEFAIGLITDRLRRIKNGEPIIDVYNDLGAYDDLKDPCAEMLRALKSDREFLADAYLAEHAPKPLESYLAFANMLCVEDAGLDYDAAVAVAKAMHKRKMVIPNE